MFILLDLPVYPIDSIGPLYSRGIVSEGEIIIVAVLDIETEILEIVSKVDISEEVSADKVVDI